MTLLLRELELDLDQDESELVALIARLLGVEAVQLGDFAIVRRAIDARQKNRIRRIYSVRFSLAGGDRLLADYSGPGKLEPWPQSVQPEPLRFVGRHRALVVGMGPAGLFAALRLARSGVQVCLVDRGQPVERRVRDVNRFWSEGQLDPESNVQFGEGGAGTFSDGKLTTRINHPLTRLVLETLVEFGAPPEVLVEAKPHIGTDRLRLVLVNFRRELLHLGVDIRYAARLTGLRTAAGRICGGLVNDAEELAADSLVLAPGHSARETYRLLQRSGVALEAKPFAVGVRIEHPAGLINRIQYGEAAGLLPAADYRLAWTDPQSGRGIYSFCMCPGGEVVNSSSDPGGVVVNGMSSYRRAGNFSNSALVVSVTAEDFPGSGMLAGLEFQRRLERDAFAAGGGDYRAPAQNLLEFLGRGRGAVRSTCRPGVRAADLRRLLPEAVVAGLQGALPVFDRKMRGFLTGEAVLVGVETRTSAPLRILRGEDGQSLSHPGLYPAGEGAGYAGGIMSAALDGLRSAERLIHNQLGNGSDREKPLRS